MTDRGEPATRPDQGPRHLPPVTSPTVPVPLPTGPITTVLERPRGRSRRVGSHALPQEWADGWLDDAAEGLFAPVVAPSAPHTPGLGYAFGPGRRIPRGPQAGQAGEPGVEPTTSATAPAEPPSVWAAPERVEYAELQRAVDAVFEDDGAGPATVELIRPYIEHVGHDDGESVWAGVGVVPPPTPVTGVSRDGVASIGTALPTRRQLRERQRAEQSARSAARNRLAKGGVLAMAMFGAVATQAPQTLHDRLFGATATTATTVDPGAAVLAAEAPARVVDTSLLPRDGVEATLRNQLIKQQVKQQQVQTVGEAAQSAGGVLVAVAKAQAASDRAAREAALARAAREAQRNPKALARAMVAQRGWSSAQFTCLDLLWTRESTWNHRATNPSSGAYGIPQSLPAGKMASAGSDWRTNPATQIKWGLGYIAGRYGTPCGAWNHSEAHNWY